MAAEILAGFLPPFGAGLGCLLAVATLLDNDDRDRRLILAGLYLSIAALLLHGHLFHERALIHVPWFFRLQVPFAFLFGPLFWLHIRMRLDRDVEFRRPDLLHLIPAAVAALLVLSGLLRDSATQTNILQAAFERPANDPGLQCFLIGVCISNVYFLVSIHRLLAVARRDGPHRTNAVLLILTGLAAPAFSILVFLGLVLKNPALAQAQLIATSCLLMAFFLIQRRYPDFFIELRKADRNERYMNPQLGPDALERLDRQLEELIEADSFYRDADLGLPDLSRRLNVSTHQLSEYFNLHRDTSFRGFLNQLRVKAASELLKTDAERTVLSVGYEVGFQSKSAFNRVFRELTGKTPSQHRRAQK
ncbi:MAG: helix-turn-helix domain-containing protein [bacterium]|nr:helix-turn-helix domain-containing protein [bacterium]